MIEAPLDEIVAVMGGTATGPVAGVPVRGVGTDSRTVQPGELFFAIPGERFDGHDFIDQAFDNGAVGCVVSRATPSSVGLCIRVDDTTLALGRCASEHRRHVTGTVIAVTGSNGKTTTKDMIHHVLGGRLRGRAAVRSFNNNLGVPLTLLSARADDEYLVVEIGSNAPGEVEHLAKMAAPDVGVITTIGPAHLEGLGGIEGVVREKTSLLKHVRSGGLAVVNADRAETRAWLRARPYTLMSETPRGLKPAVRGGLGRTLTCGGAGVVPELVTFGQTDGVDLRVTDVRSDLAGTRFRINTGPEVCLPICGAHNALNATAALAVSRRMGLDTEEIVAALASFQLADMRLNVSRRGPITVINDSYNANPSSMSAAIEVLALSAGRRRVLVAGDMLELGAEARLWHKRIGAEAARAGIDLLVAVGSCADDVAGAAREVKPSIETRTYADAEQAGAEVAGWLCPGDVVLIKGSRAMGMERVARAAATRSAC